MSDRLTPELIEAAYREGYFPMADDEGTIRWYRPDPRAIIPIESFHVPGRLARTLRRKDFVLTRDRDFEGVIRGCAGREETWISPEILEVYTEMHRRGSAHSVEASRDGQLVGGIYGVSIGGASMGESMFSRESAASSACLVFLAGHLRDRGYRLFDIQFMTDHLARFGAIEIPGGEYDRRLRAALRRECDWQGE